MAIWHYYNEKKKKITVTGGQLKGLAKAGLITPETMVETENGKSARAGKVKGLTFVAPAPPDEVEPYGLAQPKPPSEPSPFTATIPEVRDMPETTPQEIDNPFTATMPVAKPAAPQRVPLPATGEMEHTNPRNPIPLIAGLGLWLLVPVLLGIGIASPVGMLVLTGIAVLVLSRNSYKKIAASLAVLSLVLVIGVGISNSSGGLSGDDKKGIVTAKEFIEYVIRNENNIYNWSANDADEFMKIAMPLISVTLGDKKDEKTGEILPKPAFKNTDELRRFLWTHANVIKFDIPRRSRDQFQRELRELIRLSSGEIERARGRVSGSSLADAKWRSAHAYTKLLANAVDQYDLQAGQPPTTEQGLRALIEKPPELPGYKWAGPYIADKLPRDPWGNEYQYVSPGRNGRAFDIWSYGADRIDGTNDDIGNWMERP
jgi:general secretion pathway protein G